MLKPCHRVQRQKFNELKVSEKKHTQRNVCFFFFTYIYEQMSWIVWSIVSFSIKNYMNHIMVWLQCWKYICIYIYKYFLKGKSTFTGFFFSFFTLLLAFNYGTSFHGHGKHNLCTWLAKYVRCSIHNSLSNMNNGLYLLGNVAYNVIPLPVQMIII